jgi:hypothetical protein
MIKLRSCIHKVRYWPTHLSDVNASFMHRPLYPKVSHLPVGQEVAWTLKSAGIMHRTEENTLPPWTRTPVPSAWKPVTILNKLTSFTLITILNLQENLFFVIGFAHVKCDSVNLWLGFRNSIISAQSNGAHTTLMRPRQQQTHWISEQRKKYSATCYMWPIRSHGCAMAQAVSRRPLTSEARVRSRVSSCGICGGQSGNGTGFPPSTLVPPPPSFLFHRCSITRKSEK